MIRAPGQGRALRRLLLLALMGFALASRLALGALVLPAEAAPGAPDALAQLQAAMILCHAGGDKRDAPPLPHQPAPREDLLLAAEQADNAHALASAAALPAPCRPAAILRPARPPAAAGPPRPWRSAWQPRGPPAAG
jgi:hypothetical protein